MNRRRNTVINIFLILSYIVSFSIYGFESIQQDVVEYDESYLPDVTEPGFDYSTLDNDDSSEEEVKNNKLFSKSALNISTNNNTQDEFTGLMSSGQPIKITADPNENIDLFSGILHLNYKDISIPVIPGLNMEVTRKYSSEIYEKVIKRISSKGPNFFYYAQNGWSLNPGYIDIPLCNSTNPKCNYIYVDSNGQKHVIMNDQYQDDIMNTQDHYKFERKFTIDKITLILTAPNGNKLYFELSSGIGKGIVRHYLTRIETPDAKHYINYHYEDILLTKITSSDSNKNIEIKYKNIDHNQHVLDQHFSEHDGKIHTIVPDTIYFNDKKMVKYEYKLGKMRKHEYLTAMLTKVRLGNGYEWNYNYNFYNLRVKHHKHEKGEDYVRAFITSVEHPNGEVTKYQYGLDFSLRYQKKMHLPRLSKRQHYGNSNIADGEWQFENIDGPIIENNKTKLVKVKGPYNTIDYIYNAYQNDNVWKIGLPAKINIYRDHDDNEGGIVQQETYTWQAVVQNYKKNYASLKHSDEIHDHNTYRPLLKSKIIKRDGVDYKTEYADFDYWDSPRTIVQSSGNNKRVIKRTIQNIPEKNILGLTSAITVDGKQILKNNYDEFGRIIASKKHGRETLWQYQNGLLESTTDANGNSIKYSNYVGGVPSTVIYPDESTEDFLINDYGLIDISYNKKGNASKFEYDDFGRLTKETPALGESIEHKYGIYQKTTLHGGHELSEKFNAYNQLINSTENNDITSRAEYDALGRKVFQSYPQSRYKSVKLNAGHKYQYDSIGRLLFDCYPVEGQQACIKYSYLSNNRVRVDYPNGEYSVSSYRSYGDPDNGALVKIQQDSRITEINRDNLDYITSIKQGNITKEYQYDRNYNLIKYTEPETGITTFSYDKVGNVLKKANNNKYIDYFYDQLNYNLLAKKYSDDSYDEYYEYDILGNLISTDKGRIKNIYQYNDNNSLVKAKTVLNINGTTNEYNLAYNYNSLGHLESLVYPDGVKINYNPNSLGQPTRVGDYIHNIQYHNNKVWSGYTYGSGITASSSLDDGLRVNEFQFGSLLQKFNYDSNNNLINYYISDHNEASFKYNLSMFYDKTGRLITSNGPWGNLHYQYDANDNILSMKKTSTTKNKIDPSEIINLSYRSGRLDSILSSNKLSSETDSFSYDAHGNIDRDSSNRYLYGIDGNLLTSMGMENATYDYDINNNRVIRKINNNEIYSIYDPSGIVLYEVDTKNNKYTKFVYFNGHRVAEEIKQNDKVNTYYFYNDQLGSPVAKTDAKGSILWRQVYKPFGSTYFDNNDDHNKHGFMGRDKGENNLTYIGARYYNSNLGRFMSPDPVSVKPDIPATLNRYAYGANNPYKYVDTDGRELHLLTPVGALLFTVGGLQSAYPLYKEGNYVGAFIAFGVGGAVTAAAGPRAARIANAKILASLGLKGSKVVKAISEVGLNTAAIGVTNLIGHKEFNFYKSLKSSSMGFLISKKINPMGLEAESVPEALLFTSNSSLMSKMFGLFDDYVEKNNTTSILNKEPNKNDSESNAVSEVSFCNTSSVSVHVQFNIKSWKA